MTGQPKVIREITYLLFFHAGASIIGFSLMLTGALWMDAPMRILAVIGGAIGIGLGVYLAVLAYGFHKLRPWAYKPAYFLLKLSSTAWLLGLYDKIDDPEIRRAFGLDEP